MDGRHDNHTIVLNADSPDELAAEINRHEGSDVGTMSQPIRKEEENGSTNKMGRE
jgi:hypothetical protein